MSLKRVGWCAIALTALAGGSAAAFDFEGNPKNGLSSQAFLRNSLTTNQQALQALMTTSLTLAPGDTLFSGDPYAADQLHDPRARAVMHEIVKCALAPSATVPYLDPLDGNRRYVWQGELGLCQQPTSDLGSPSWGPTGPNEPCQQLVTACVTARVNAMKRAIPLSIRGPSSDLFPLREKVFTEQRFRESPSAQDPSEGYHIVSFSGPLCMLGHECNWAPALVGRCTGGQVKLAIQNPAVCHLTPVRVCAGIHGCYKPGGLDVPPPGFPTALNEQYVKYVVDKTGACLGAEISFPCHTEIPVGGYYSVMTRPVQTGPIQQVDPPSPELVKVSGTGDYPLREEEVFTFREGAYYGNLFAPGELSWHCEVAPGLGMRICAPINGTQGELERCPLQSIAGVGCSEKRTVPYRHVYACYSFAQEVDSQGTGSDAQGVGYLNSRVCNEPDPTKTCFFHKPKRCFYADPVMNANFGAGCEWLAGEGIYHNCRSFAGTPPTLYPPVTTYLNDPCDLAGDDRICNQVRRSYNGGGGPAGGLAVQTGPRGGCAGCAVEVDDRSRVGLLAALIGPVALMVHGRRRAGASRRLPAVARRPPTTPR